MPDLPKRGQYCLAGDGGRQEFLRVRAEEEGQSPRVEAVCFVELLGSRVAHRYPRVGPGQENRMGMSSHVGESGFPWATDWGWGQSCLDLEGQGPQGTPE